MGDPWSCVRSCCFLSLSPQPGGRQTNTAGLRILSWNVRGALDKIKRGAILRQAKRYSAEILMLQETHLLGTKASCLLRYGFAQAFHAGFARGSRGVAILIHGWIPYLHSRAWVDTQGRYIFLQGTIYGEQVILGSVYAPPPLSWTPAERILTLWEDIPPGVAVICGDWNYVMDGSRDRWRQSGLPAISPTTKLSSLAAGLGWMDTWRALHGVEQAYTYFSSVHASFSWLDYLFVPAEVILRVREVDILPRGLSDNSPMALTLQLGPARPPFRWRLSTWNLQDERYREHIDRAIDQYLSLNAGTVTTA